MHVTAARFLLKELPHRRPLHVDVDTVRGGVGYTSVGRHGIGVERQPQGVAEPRQLVVRRRAALSAATVLRRVSSHQHDV